jgi:hypothetical protein
MLLFGGPVSVTALSVVEVLRLRQKYPADFPFRSGPQAIRPRPASGEVHAT